MNRRTRKKNINPGTETTSNRNDIADLETTSVTTSNVDTIGRAGEIGSATSWMVDALCAQIDPELYDLNSITAQSIPGTKAEKAQRLCSGCPVLRECARYALADPPIRGLVVAGVDVPALQGHAYRAARCRLEEIAYA